MIGRLISVERGLERNVKVTVTVETLASEISSPSGPVDPRQIQGYEIAQSKDREGTLSQLYFVLSTGGRVRFYSTYSTFDLALLLDQLDGTIGERPRTLLPSATPQ